MDDRERRILENFLRFVQEADQETKERILCFCEGVAMGRHMAEEKEVKPA